MARWEYREPAGRFFTSSQRNQVTVLLEAILPGSETNPGATDANAAEYVDRLLAMDAKTYYDIPRWRQQYSQALPILAGAAAARFGGKALEGLSTVDATSLLGDLAKGLLFGPPAQGWQTDFFATLRAHAIEGCFADQRWGGNQHNVVWQWYGYPTGPSRDFRRSTGGLVGPDNTGPQIPDELAANPPVDWVPLVSGNTWTAMRPLDEMQSATLLPELAKQAATLTADNKPGTPWPE